MRVYVVYDRSGAITGLSTHPEGAPEPVMRLETGERDGFVDVSQVDANASEKERFGQLEDLMAEFRVKVEGDPDQLSLAPTSEGAS
ncbi:MULTISPECIES: hypothetical protein [unclassified Streptomyces]|uniref:hypothetical protein n=1 Tax=unclassified Streptomyces TaxID=2593676 RepID=UPI000B125E3C|nr:MULTISPECIES: hypothetical protein [unclassified Streptomyces]